MRIWTTTEKTWTRALSATAAAVALAAAPAAAQDATVYATASADGNQTNIALIGGSIRPEGLGLKPSLGLQVYRLQYESGVEDVARWAVTPSVGLGYRMPTGSVEARVGYSFQTDDEERGEAPFLLGEGGRSGVVTSAQGNYWGTGAGPELQGIASYNWRSDYVWTQAQATVPVLPVGRGLLSAGAEAVWQGEVESSELGEEYRSWSAGPVLKLSTGRESSVVLGAGYKDTSNRDEGTWYARVGVVRYGIGF